VQISPEHPENVNCSELVERSASVKAVMTHHFPKNSPFIGQLNNYKLLVNKQTKLHTDYCIFCAQDVRVIYRRDTIARGSFVGKE
jgi:hypothetical protein